jgi:hypothetical protein
MKHKIILFLFFVMNFSIHAQDIILDKIVRAGELVLFQSMSNANEYYYLSDKARLAIDPATGKPQFSFLRYVENQRSGSDQANKEEGDGGGIVHCVIELGVTQEQLSAARQGLSRINSNGTIKGPTLYQGGTIALISSVNDPTSGFSKKILGLGKAPILDGQKAAISINLTKLGAKILWESFQMPAPDMSFSFEMDLKGYRSPKGFTIEANFDQIYQHSSFSAAAITRQGNSILAGEINTAYEDLFKSGAIKVTQRGTDENIEKALEDAYGKLTRMMFDPASSGATPAAPALPGAASTSLLDRAQTLLNEGRRDALEDFLAFAGQERELLARSRDGSGSQSGQTQQPIRQEERETNRGMHSRHRPPNTDISPEATERYAYERPRPTMPTTAAVVSYSMRTSRQRGIFKIDLNKYTTDNLSLRFDHNVGKINCTDCFRQINLDDPLYKQREIAAILDGYNSEDFQKYINYVTVTMRKKHESGEYTNDEIQIDKTKFNQQGNFFKMLYGWKGDNNRLKWRDYEYKTVWNFFGGANFEGQWTKTDVATIPLSPPYNRRVIDIELDGETVKKEGLRTVEVKVFYKVEDKEMVKQVRLNLKNGQLSSQVEVLLPASYLVQEPKYEYEILWILSDGNSSGSSIIFADKI